MATTRYRRGEGGAAAFYYLYRLRVFRSLYLPVAVVTVWVCLTVHVP